MLLKTNVLVSVGIACLVATSVSGQRQQHFDAPSGVSEASAVERLPGSTAAIFQSAGLSMLDGELLGGGPGYAVRLDGGGVEFTPAIPTAADLHPLTLRVSGYGRGAAELAPGDARLSHTDTTARYDHGAFVETLEMRADGMKQNFVFDRLPAGQGDLVVRLQVTTNLAASTHDDGSLQFLTADGEGGVSIGAVVGIDADGVRADGTMSYSNGSLEFRLPESFVSTAALPLVLDPLVGSAVSIASGVSGTDLDVAYDASENLYCVVWTRNLSGFTFSTHAQRLSDTGAPIGGLLTIEPPGSLRRPRIANVATEDAFLVVYEDGVNIVGRALRLTSASASVGPQGVIRATSDLLRTPDVGGESVFDNEAVVVWLNVTANRIEARQVNVDGDVTPPTVAASATTVNISASSGSGLHVAPRISNSGGTTGNHCIVWSRGIPFSPNSTVQAVIVNRNVIVLEANIDVTSNADGDCDLPVVDGNGLNWVIAWQRRAAALDNDIQARAVGLNLNAATPNQGYFASGIVNVESNVNDDERNASVAWMGDSALICYEDESFTPGDYDVFCQPVDVFTCQDSALREFVDQAGGDQGFICAASKAMGGGASDNALLIWSEEDLSSGDRRTYVRRFRADDGINTNLGGGCGTAGEVFADCASIGYGGFAVRLRGSIPNSAAVWVISPARFDLPCGSCTLVPDPWNGWVIPTTVNFRGDATLAPGIPADSALIGAQFVHQWLIADPTSAGCHLFDADLSDALRTTIQ